MAHPPTFDALPAELKILVFSYTTIKGQLNCRCANRSIKSLLDDTKNREIFARSRISARLDHFASVTKNVVQAIPGLPYLEALQRFTRLRGIQLDEEGRHDDATTFARCRYEAAFDRSTHQSVVEHTAGLTQVLLDLHAQSHYLGSAEVKVERFMNDAVDWGSFVGLSDTAIAPMVLSIRHRKDVLYPPLKPQKSRKEDGGFPRIPLTPLNCTGTSRTRKVRFQGFCTVLEMAELLDVPYIGDTGDFCYFTESIWAYHMLQQYLYGRKLTLVEKAALLEEIDIY
ncbi:Putative F-box-like domain superfamily protein [Septoria linicola]|uniref:F-box-like domain superfamily protein n=1 Tax=Septoria linicola TaxID=215465 RepID=A0A9Q9EI30_9PEZI|nr:putative F-box-like domain superfamily protein [Septoria linicola]USW49908.1 Putative F-box-like domain superfamily protein [Septoria linicola]